MDTSSIAIFLLIQIIIIPVKCLYCQIGMIVLLIHSTDQYNYWRIWPKIINWSLIEMIGFNEASKCKWTDNLKNVFRYCWFIVYYRDCSIPPTYILEKCWIIHNYTGQFSDRTVWDRHEVWTELSLELELDGRWVGWCNGVELLRTSSSPG